MASLTGNPFIDQILSNALTGRSMAALGQLSAPLAQTPATRPRTVTQPLTVEEMNRRRQEVERQIQQGPQVPPASTDVMRILSQLGATGPAPTIPSIPQAPPIDPAIIERFRSMAGQAPPPFTPTVEPRQTFLQELAQTLQRGVTAGLTNDPGATLLALSQQDVQLAERRRSEEERRRERAEDRQERFTQTQRQFELTGVQEATRKSERAQDLEIRRQEKQFDREFQEHVRRLGLKDQGAIELLRDALQTERDRDRERAADEKLTQQQRLQLEKEVGEQIRFYRQNGVRDSGMAKRLAWNDYRGMAEQLKVWKPQYELQRGDTAALAKVDAQIERLRQLAARGGAGGGGASDANKVLSWIELSDGNIVAADKVNFDRLPVGVSVKRIFSTVGGQELKAQGGALTSEMVDATLANDKSLEQREATIKALRSRATTSAEKAMVEERIRASQLPGQNLTPLQRMEERGSFMNSPLGRMLSGVGERFSRAQTVGFLRSRLQTAEAQLSREKDPATRAELQALVDDLRSRLEVATQGFLKEVPPAPSPTPRPRPTAPPDLAPLQRVSPTPTPRR